MPPAVVELILKAAAELGIDPKQTSFDVANPQNFVLDLTIHERVLQAMQRAIDDGQTKTLTLHLAKPAAKRQARKASVAEVAKHSAKENRYLPEPLNVVETYPIAPTPRPKHYDSPPPTVVPGFQPFDSEVDTDRLTKKRKPREPWQVRENRDAKKNDPFEGLEALAAPKHVAAEIRKLAKILENAKAHEPNDKQKFVNLVNTALRVNKLAIKIDGTQEICLRLRVVKSSIMLQPTKGGIHAFKKCEFSLVDYIRPYARKDGKA